MVLLEYVTQPKKKSRQGSNESREELAVRQSSPKSWTVAFIPTPETFAPLPTRSEVVVNTQIQWGLPPSLQQLETRTVGLPILSLAEVGTTVSADHLLQMATMPLEHKPKVLGIPYSIPVSYQFDGAEELLHSLHALFGLLATANTPRYCGTDSAHILSIALSIVSALQSGRSTLAVAGVLGAGKTRSLTFLLAWFAITTFGVAHKENPAGRAITKLLSSLDLDEDQQTLFVRPSVGKKQLPTQPARNMTKSCSTVQALYQGQGWSLPLLASSGNKKGKPTRPSERTWKVSTCSLAKRPNRTWTSSLPLSQQSRGNLSFESCLATLGKVQVG